MTPENPGHVPPSLSPVPVFQQWQYVSHPLNSAGFFTTGNVDPKVMNDTLNWYGSQGWELVSTFDTAGNTGGTVTVVLIFKRPAPI